MSKPRFLLRAFLKLCLGAACFAGAIACLCLEKTGAHWHRW
ncbi:MAG: hypothetical protein ACJ76Y_23185 [Thermoanaerobaculia bacterium]